MKITSVETIQLEPYPYLIIVRIGTDDGLVGVSDTYYTTDSIREFVHGFAAPLLLGSDPMESERIWNELYYRNFARWGGFGMEFRALSAIDVALWDLRGQALGAPVWQLLGGLAQPSIPTYNTCSGPMYGAKGFNRMGEGDTPLDDLWAQFNAPERLATSLLDEGIKAMKIWPFDRFALEHGSHHISAEDLKEGLEPFRRIRAEVGGEIDIMLDGHGYWDLATATRIARALEEFDLAWVEDLVLGHDIEEIAQLRAATTTPVIASEMVTTKQQYRALMERRAADIVMIDPTWAGGITESRKILGMAEAFGYGVSMHDCTGPFTLLAGLNLALSSGAAIYQESVRAYLRTWYAELATDPIVVQDGKMLPPTRPGIGAALRPEVLERADATVRTTTATS